MSLSIRPLLSALRRSPAGAILVTLQVAITLGVLVNAAWVVHQHIERMEQPVGYDTQDIFAIDITSLTNKFNVAQAESEDLIYLRGLTGVTAATVTGGIPMTGEGSSFGRLWREPGQRGPSVRLHTMTSDDQALRTLGVHLVAGRNFSPTEIRPFSPVKKAAPAAEIIVTQALAQALFPGGSALGRTVYDNESDPLTIIGITRNFIGAVDGEGVFYKTGVFPTLPGVYGYVLLARTRSGKCETILAAARQHIGAAHRDGVISDAMTLTDAKRAFESDSRNIAIFLTAVTALMLSVCCLGIFGLTTFNVGSRIRQIGTRRAVGARRRDIVTHFMVENAIVLTVGALLGSVLAVAVGDWLTAHYSLPRLDLAYLAGGVPVLWIIGQLAAWQPARRAARIPPSVATRTV